MECNRLAWVIWFYQAAPIASLAGGGKLLICVVLTPGETEVSDALCGKLT